MLRIIALALVCIGVCSTTLAARITTETRVGGDKISRTDTYANSAGDLRIDERGYGSSSSASDSASSNSQSSIEYHLGKIKETTLYQVKDEAIVSLEGNICRRLTADSAPPPGLGVPGMNMPQMNQQMADAMKQAGSAIDEAMKQARAEGMSAEQEAAFNQFINPLKNANKIKPRGSLEFTALNKTISIGPYSADGYLIRDSDGVEKHRVWMVPVNKIEGGKEVRGAMERMARTYEQYMEKLGTAALMDTSLTGLFMSREFSDKYPVRIEDLDSGEITDVVEASAGTADAEFYPECEERNIMGM